MKASLLSLLRKTPAPAERPVRAAKSLAFEEVEARVLFSAVPFAGSELDASGGDSAAVIDEAPQYYVPEGGAEAGRSVAPIASLSEGNPVDGLPHAVEDALLDELNGHAASIEDRREIVFISADLLDSDYLLAHLDGAYEVHLLSADGGDAIEQIARALEGASGIDAIHLVGHGTEGRLFLGGTVLDTESMSGHHREWLEAIGRALSAEADILIYGCDFAAGEAGLAAAELLAGITGADVAASSDATGHHDLGGNWILEHHHGAIEATALAPTAWEGLLAPIAFSITNNATTLANNIIGDGVTLNAATFTGGPNQAATFTGATGFSPEWLGYSSGILLTTGHPSQVVGPNISGGQSVVNGTPGDAQLAVLGRADSFDAAILEFTFTPTSNRITMQFTFGSDEYSEYVYSAFNDAMGVWVNGTQVAVTPSGDPISINTINQAANFAPTFGVHANDPDPGNGVWDSSNPNLYINNSPGSGAYNTGMDGFTVTLSFVAEVNMGVQNTIRIGISDIGDASWDSWLFIRSDSLVSTTIAYNDTATTPVGTPVVIDALANDWDQDGDPLTITHVLDKPIVAGGPAIALPSGSTVALNLDGTLTFTPVAGSTQQEVFSYTISDGQGTTAVGFVTVSIDQSPVNTLPGAQTASEDTALAITGVSVSDPDSASLTTVLSLPDGTGTLSVVEGGGAAIAGNGSGTVTLSGTAAQINAALATITYAPAPDFNTGDPAAPIALTVATSDATSTTTGTIPLTVNPVADATNDSVSVNEDEVLVFNVLSGSNGATADTFSDPAAVVTSVTQPANGTVSFLPNGQITYTPNADWHGIDTFTYTVNAGGSNETATVTVTVDPVNDAPVAVGTIAAQSSNDSEAVVPLATSGNFFDVDGDTLTYSATGLPAGLSINPLTGVIAGTLGTSASQGGVGGVHTVLVTAADPDGASVTQSFIWTVANPAPTANNDDFAANEDDGPAVVGNALDNDSDPDGDVLGAVPQSNVVGTNGGLFSIDGVGNVTFDPNGDFGHLAEGVTLTTAFTYTLIDANGATSTATVTVTVTGANDAPLAAPDTFTVAEDGSVLIDVLDNDSDIDGDAIHITHVNGEAITEGGPAVAVANGSVALVAGQLLFTPTPDYHGPASFTYTIADIHGASATATVTGEVTEVAEYLTVSSGQAVEGGAITFTVTFHGTSSAGFTVEVLTLAGTAQGGGVDYHDLAGHVLSFVGFDGETHSFTVSTVNDGLIEENETFTVAFANASSGKVDISATGTGTILDNDARVLPAGPGTGVTTDVELVLGADGLYHLVIEDVETDSGQGFDSSVDDADSSDNLLVFRDGDHFVIRDLGGLWLGSPVIGATRSAANEIRIPAAMVTGGIVIRSGLGNDTITLGNLGTLNGPVIIDGGDGEDRIIQTGGVVLSGDHGATYTAEGIHLRVGSSLSTDSGAITLTGTGGSGNLAGVWLEGASLASATGDVTLLGTGGTSGHYNDGVRVGFHRQTQTTSSIVTGGSISLTGTGGVAGNQARGVHIDRATVSATGAGSSVTLVGTGGAAGNSAQGVHLFNSAVSSADGDLTLTGAGTGPAASSQNQGVSVWGGSLAAGGGGNLGILGNGGGGTTANHGVFLYPSTSVSVAAGDLTVRGVAGGSAGLNKGVFAQRASFTSAGAGAILIEGTGSGAGAHSSGVELVSGSLVEAFGSGTITLEGSGSAAGSSYGRGVFLSTGSTVRSASGDIVIEGLGRGSLLYNSGVAMHGNVLVEAGSGGALSVAGSGGAGTLGNHGVWLQTAATLRSANGGISVTGTAAGSGGQNTGILSTNSTVRSTGLGLVSLLGVGSATGAAGGNEGIFLSGTTVSAASGDLELEGVGGTGRGQSYGLRLMNSTASAAGGSVALLGTAHAATTGTLNAGVMLQTSAVSGESVSVEGLGGGGSLAQGIRMVGGSATASDGSVSFLGTSRATTVGTFNAGVHLQNAALSGSSGIAVSGTGGGGSGLGYGINVLSSTLAGHGGATSLTGTARATTTGSLNAGVMLQNAQVSGASLSVTGTGGGGTLAQGVRILGGSLTAASGAAALAGTGGGAATGVFNSGLHLQGTALNAAGGFALSGTGGLGRGLGYGVYLLSSTLNGNGGSSTIVGTARAAATGSFNVGVLVQGGSLASSSLSVTGTGGGGAMGQGIRLMGGSVVATGGPLTLLGASRSGTTGSWNVGTFVQGSTLSGGAGSSVSGSGGGGLRLNHGVFMQGIGGASTISRPDVSGSSGAGAPSLARAGNFFA